jgi:hypothetical protein
MESFYFLKKIKQNGSALAGLKTNTTLDAFSPLSNQSPPVSEGTLASPRFVRPFISYRCPALPA